MINCIEKVEIFSVNFVNYEYMNVVDFVRNIECIFYLIIFGGDIVNGVME